MIVNVEDNGVGFDPEEYYEFRANRESFGIMSMRERIELLDGEFKLKSEVGRGTLIVARIKMQPPEASTA